MQNTCQVSVAEFKNVDVVPCYRGFKGGDLLMQQVISCRPRVAPAPAAQRPPRPV